MSSSSIQPIRKPPTAGFEDRPGPSLIGFVGGLSVSKLPPDVVRMAQTCLLDSIGCGLFGAGMEWSRIVADEMIAEGARGHASVFGRKERLAAPSAALCNGTASHGYELDDLIAGSVVHPGATVIPAALAAAEAADAPGSRLIEAIVAGYEVTHRVGMALGTEAAKRGFHTTSLVAPVACAAAAGVAMGLPQDKLLSAVGLACSTAAGIKNFATGHGGGMVKRLHIGRAAEAGVRVAQLARAGFAGPPLAIDGRFGLLEIYGGAGADPSRLTVDLGEDWAMRRVWFKVYPVCGWIQTVIQQLVALRDGRDLQPDQIAAVRVGVSRYAVQNNGEPAPVDTMGAQYSIPYCAALSLLGDPSDPQSYQHKTVHDPRIRRLAAKVEVFVDPEVEAVYPAKFGASVSLRLADGEQKASTVLDCHGTPSDPCSDVEMRDKFKRLSAGRLPEDRADRLAAVVSTLPTLGSIRLLTDILAA